MNRISLTAFVLVTLALMFAPPEAQAHVSETGIWRCSWAGQPTICYDAAVRVFPNASAEGHRESCDVKNYLLVSPGLESQMNALFGGGYVHVIGSNDHATGGSNTFTNCQQTTYIARYNGRVPSCPPGGPLGWTHVAEHWVRWKEETRAWRGNDIHTFQNSGYPLPNDICQCGDDSGGGGWLP